MLSILGKKSKMKENNNYKEDRRKFGGVMGMFDGSDDFTDVYSNSNSWRHIQVNIYVCIIYIIYL
jgi:hypothetical protein